MAAPCPSLYSQSSTLPSSIEHADETRKEQEDVSLPLTLSFQSIGVPPAQPQNSDTLRAMRLKPISMVEALERKRLVHEVNALLQRGRRKKAPSQEQNRTSPLSFSETIKDVESTPASVKE